MIVFLVEWAIRCYAEGRRSTLLSGGPGRRSIVPATHPTVLRPPKMITIRFPDWISGMIVSFHTDIQKLLSKRELDTDKETETLYWNFEDLGLEINFGHFWPPGESCTLHYHLFIIFGSIFSAFCAMPPSRSIHYWIVFGYGYYAFNQNMIRIGYGNLFLKTGKCCSHNAASPWATWMESRTNRVSPLD